MTSNQVWSPAGPVGPQANNQDVALSNLLQMSRPAPDPRILLQNDAAWLAQRHQQGRSEFVDAGGDLYFEYDLERVPFVFCTAPQFGFITLKGQTQQSEVCRVGVRMLSFETGQYSQPLLASLMGRYILPRIKRMYEDPNEFFGGHYTIMRDPAMPLTPQGDTPFSIKRYNRSTDQAPEVTEEQAAGMTPPDMSASQLNAPIEPRWGVIDNQQGAPKPRRAPKRPEPPNPF